MIDTHAHLYLLSDPQEALASAHLAAVINVGIDVDTSRQALIFAQKHQQVYAAAGVHPNSAQSATPVALAEIERLLAHPKMVAVGETGLDFYRDHCPPAQQEGSFLAHIALANRLGKPLIVHCRSAGADVVRLLRQEQARSGVMHCFSGETALLEGALELGFYISFAGNVTFPSAKALREAALLVPEDRLLVETDCPFLAPQPRRGQPNEPGYVRFTIEKIAQLRGWTPEEAEARTDENARRLFGLG